MKKSLIILPLLAVVGGALASCGNDGPKVNYYDQIEGPHEIEGHKLADKLVDGKQYYLGVYDPSIDDVRFINGDPHRDSGKEYPFYMAKNDEGGLDNAAKVEVKFTDSSHFKLLVHTPDEDQHWSEKYITLYAASSSYGNNLLSIHAADEGETEFVDIDGNTQTILTYEYEWMESYLEMPVYSSVFKYQDEREAEEEAIPRMFGTGIDTNAGEQYKSVDCKVGTSAVAEDYWIAHFFEA